MAKVSNNSLALMDQYGHNQVVNADANGEYAITLKGARCDKEDGCAVGGAVQIIHSAQATIQEKTSNGTLEIKFD
jgi:hypothetical protein